MAAPTVSGRYWFNTRSTSHARKRGRFHVRVSTGRAVWHEHAEALGLVEITAHTLDMR